MRFLAEHHPPPSPPTPSKEQEGVRSRRGSDGKLRGRKRTNDPAPPLDSDIEVSDTTAPSRGTMGQGWQTVRHYRLASQHPCPIHTDITDIGVAFREH